MILSPVLGEIANEDELIADAGEREGAGSSSWSELVTAGQAKSYGLMGF